MSTWLLLIIPLVAAVTIVLVTSKYKDLSSYISIAAIVACFFIVLPKFMAFLGHPDAAPIEAAYAWLDIPTLKIEIGTIIDKLSIMMLFIVTFVGSLIHIYSRGYMHGEAGFSRFFACLSFFIFSMLGIVLSNNFIMIFIFWELVGLASYLLIGYYFEKPSAADAAKKAFIVNRVGDFGFVLGILVLFYATGTVNFIEMEHVISEGNVDGCTLFIGSLLIFCGAMGKSAQLPLHVWLPDAMEGPTPVSALIHAATMVAAGVYMLARSAFVFAAAPPSAMMIIAVIGGLTAFMAAVIALCQVDIKKIVAYSTLSSLGYMVMSFGVGGTGASLFYLSTHAFFKALLFLAAGSVIHAFHTNDIWKMGALVPKMKITSITFILGSLAMMGVFPFSGFFSKDAILAAALESNILLFCLGLLTAYVTALFMTRLLIVVFFGEKRWEHEPHESPYVMTIPLMVLTVFAVLGGYFENIFHFSSWGEAVASVGGHGADAAHGGGHGDHHTLVAILSTVAVFAGIITGWFFYMKSADLPGKLAARFSCTYDAITNLFYFDNFYDKILVAKIFNGIGRMCNYIEVNVVISFIVNGTSYLTREAGKALRLTVSGKVNHYVLAMVGGLLVIIFALAIGRIG